MKAVFGITTLALWSVVSLVACNGSSGDSSGHSDQNAPELTNTDPMASENAVPAGPQALAAGDWDGDGDLDLAVANFGVSLVDVLKNQP